VKKILLLVHVFVFSLWAEPEWTSSLEEAKTLAHKENKHLILMLSREECDACWYMKNIVFENDNVKVLIEEHFIGVNLDVDLEDIPARFSYLGTPTFYFMDANGTELGHQLNGAANVKDFTQKVNQILKKDKE